MTAEELAEIKKANAFIKHKCAEWLRREPDEKPWIENMPVTIFDANAAFKHRAELLKYTDSQAQRIAELEAAVEQYKAIVDDLHTKAKQAQLAARGPDREVLAKRIKAKLRELLANPVTIDEGAASLADLVLSSGALATAHAEKLQENSCPPRRCDSAGIGGEMGSLSPVATAQAVTLTVADSKAQRGAGEYAKRSLLPYRISAKPSPQGAEDGDKP